MGYILIVAIQQMVHAAGEYSQQVVDLTAKLFAQLNEHHIQVDQAHITAELEARLPGIMTQTAGTVTSLLSHGFLIVIFVVFLLIGRNPNQQQPSGIYADIASTIRRYITTMTAIATVTGVLVGLVLWMLGLHMAWLFGLLVFLLMFIPNIGSIIATLLPIPVAVTQFQDPWMVLAVVAIPGAIHITIGNLVAPRLMGSGLELHPVTVLLALAFWGLLWGIVGMVLAVPIVAILRIVLLRFETTRPLAEILSGRLPGTGAAAANLITHPSSLLIAHQIPTAPKRGRAAEVVLALRARRQNLLASSPPDAIRAKRRFHRRAARSRVSHRRPAPPPQRRAWFRT